MGDTRDESSFHDGCQARWSDSEVKRGRGANEMAGWGEGKGERSLRLRGSQWSSVGVRWATRGVPAYCEVLVRSQQPQVPWVWSQLLGEKATAVPAGLGSRLGGLGQTPTRALWMTAAGSGWPRITMSQTVHLHTSLRFHVRLRKYLPQTALRVDLWDINRSITF